MDLKKIFLKEACPTSIGGQAIMEGIMMRGPKKTAIAVRLPDGNIHMKTQPSPSQSRWAKVPLVRGVVSFISSLVQGTKILMYSADVLEANHPEEYEKDKFDVWIENKFGKEKAWKLLMILSVAIALILSVAIFMLFPTVITGLLSKVTDSVILLNLTEGIVRLAIFVIYIALIAKMGDIKTVFQYHGAEHKTIHCFENGLELTPKNAQQFYTLHPRCGTSFIFVILILSFFFALLIPASLPTAWRVLTKLLILPLVVGVGFEFIMYAGKHENLFTKILSAPGLWMQRITTREPDDEMIQVAITSLKAALQDEFSDLALTPMPEKTGAKPSWFVGDASRLAEYLRAREIQAQEENTSQAPAQEEPSDAVPSVPQQTDGETTLSNAAVEQKVKLDAECQTFQTHSDHTQTPTETPRSGGCAS